MQITETEAQSCGHCPWELGVQGDPEARASLGPDEPYRVRCDITQRAGTVMRTSSRFSK